MRGLRRRGQADRAEAGIAALIRNDPSVAATWLTAAIATWFDEAEHRYSRKRRSRHCSRADAD